MAAAFIQSARGGDDPLSLTITTSAFALSTTVGSAIFAVASWSDDGTVNISSFSDSNGNGYNLVGSKYRDTGNSQSIQMGYSLNITNVSSSHTVTANLSSSTTFRRIVAHEVSGIATSSALDKDSAGKLQTSSSPTCTSVTPDSDGEYIFAAAMNATVQTQVFSQGPGMTEPSESTSQPGNYEMTAEYQVQSSAGAIAAPFDKSGNSESILRGATFRAEVTVLSCGVPEFNVIFPHVVVATRMLGY